MDYIDEVSEWLDVLLPTARIGPSCIPMAGNQGRSTFLGAPFGSPQYSMYRVVFSFDGLCSA
jgi:hypothetical protein